MISSQFDVASDWDFSRLGIKETQYLTHFFHHWTAKYIPQIPARIIEQYSEAGEAVLDPFMGSGTTLVEAAIRLRPAYGTDINPLAYKIAKAKTSRIDATSIAELLLILRKMSVDEAVPNKPRLLGNAVEKEAPNLFPGSEKWFRDDVSISIKWILSCIKTLDENTRNFVEVGLSDLLKGMSNARMDSIIPTLPAEAEYIDKKHYNRVVNNLTRKVNVYGRLFSQLDRMHRALCDYHMRAGDTRCVPFLADARRLSDVVPKVRLAVTSPPYWDAQNYQKLHWVSFQVLGLSEPGKSEIGRKKNDYLHDMRLVVKELVQVLDGVFAIVIGESKRGTHEAVRDICVEEGMKPIDAILRNITMHAFFAKGVKREFIYIFRNKLA